MGSLRVYGLTSEILGAGRRSGLRMVAPADSGSYKDSNEEEDIQQDGEERAITQMLIVDTGDQLSNFMQIPPDSRVVVSDHCGSCYSSGY